MDKKRVLTAGLKICQVFFSHSVQNETRQETKILLLSKRIHSRRISKKDYTNEVLISNNDAHMTFECLLRRQPLICQMEENTKKPFVLS